MKATNLFGTWRGVSRRTDVAELATCFSCTDCNPVTHSLSTNIELFIIIVKRIIHNLQDAMIAWQLKIL